MNKILDDKGHIIPAQFEEDVHIAYALFKRKGVDFHWSIENFKEAKTKYDEMLAEDKRKAEGGKAPKFDPEKFKTWAMADARYLDFVGKINEAKAKGDEELIKKLKAEGEKLFDTLKRDYVQSLAA